MQLFSSSWFFYSSRIVLYEWGADGCKVMTLTSIHTRVSELVLWIEYRTTARNIHLSYMYTVHISEREREGKKIDLYRVQKPKGWPPNKPVLPCRIIGVKEVDLLQQQIETTRRILFCSVMNSFMGIQLTDRLQFTPCSQLWIIKDGRAVYKICAVIIFW